MLDIATLGLRVDARQVRDGDKALDEFGRTGARTEKSVDRVNSAMKRMAQMAAAVASALAVVEAIKIADQMSLMDARLKLATKSMQEFAQAQRDVYAIAQKHSVAIASVSALYTKLADPIRNVGGGMDEIRAIVDAFSATLRISGASAEESSAAILQFSQAMAAGRLSGDEFNSIAEASPRLLKALAEGMKVPVGQLKAMGAEGKLTADVVGNALMSSLERLNKEAAAMPDTVGGAFARLKNDIALAISDINKATSGTSGMAGMIDAIGKMIPMVRDELTGAFIAVDKWIQANKDGLSKAFDATTLLVGQMWELAKQAGNVLGFVSQLAIKFEVLRVPLVGIAYLVAGLQDGIKMMGAGFAQLGSIIMKAALAPMGKMVELAADITDFFDTKRAEKMRAELKSVQDFANGGMRYAAQVMADFGNGETATAKLAKTLATIDHEAVKLTGSAVKAGDALKTLTQQGGGGKGKEYEAAIKSANKFIEAQLRELEAIGKTEDEQRMLNAQRAASLAPLDEQKKKIMANVKAIEAATAAEKARKAVEDAVGEDSQSLIDLDKRIAGLELEIKLHGQTGDAAVAAELAKVQAAASSLAISEEYREQLQQQIVRLERIRKLQGDKAGLRAMDEAAEASKRMSDSMGDSIRDALMRGFESGKGFFSNMWATIKNITMTQPLSEMIGGATKALTGGLMGSFSGSAAASTGGGALSGLGIGGILGTIGTGAGQTAAAILSGQIGLGSTLSAGIGAIGTGTASGIMAGLSSVVGALGPIALGIGAAVAIWKKLDTSGTYHAGGAASASSAGVQAISAGSLNMERIQTNKDTQELVSKLASGVVGILDSTALAFGKTAGYTAATAFADDTSKDGAWGSLVISKMGQSIVNWQDTRGGGKWAQKTFADGKTGQEQYLAALSASVRDALNSIGLPDWAKSMLDNVGEGATLDQLGEVVQKINETQSALAAMRSQLTGFADLSDSAVSALMAASGGIEKLYANASGYYDNFYTEGEKAAKLGQQMAHAFAAANIEMPTSREHFRAMVEASLALGEAGAPTTAKLLAMQGAVAQLYPVLAQAENAAKSAADVLKERLDLQERLDELTMSETALLAKQRAALDASNRELFDQVQAAQEAREAHDAARDSLRDLSSEYRDFARGLEAFGLSLVTGSLSPLNVGQQEAALRAQYEKTEAAALAGDKTAMGDYQRVAEQFLALSQKADGGGSRYVADYQRVLAMTDKLASYATDRADTAMLQLEAAERSAQGIEELVAIMNRSGAALSALAVAPPVAATPAASGATPSADVQALIDSLKAQNEAQSAALAAKQQELATMQAQENNRVTMAAASVVADAVTRVSTKRATADNTSATLHTQ